MEHGRWPVPVWQRKWLAGDFQPKDGETLFEVMVRAGWYDWFCADEALPDEMSRFAPIILGLDPTTCRFDLEQHYVWFKNSWAGGSFTTVRFSDVQTNQNRFVVSFQRGRFLVYDMDSSGEPFEADTAQKVVEHLSFDA